MMTLTAAQVFFLALALLVLVLVVPLYRKKKIGTLSLLLWLPLWCGVVVVILFPDVTMVVARFLGIGRGADLVLYLSVILLLYLLFRVFVRLERIDREITRIVRALALGALAEKDKGPDSGEA